jgi:putative spermidine/putrescine transport system permease protein
VGLRVIWRYLFHAVCGLIFLFLIAPIFVVIPISFSSARFLSFPPPGWSLQWYQRYLEMPQWVDATFRSLRVGLFTMVLATLIGTLAALALARYNFRGKQLIYAVIMAPMIMPVIVTAIAIYGLYSDLKLIGSEFGLVLAHTIMAVPLVVVTVTATLQGFDRSLEHAAAVMGASPIRTFFKVTFPLIQPGVLSGAIFAFIISFDEIIISVFIAGARAITLPTQMWVGIREEISPTIAAVSTLLIVLSAAVLLLTNSLTERQRKALASGTAEADEPVDPKEPTA